MKRLFIKVLILLCTCMYVHIGGVWAQTKSLAAMLGYPADAKLLIIHADDLALSHSVNRASLAALEQGAISSGSIMVPCPWLTDVIAYVKEHPEADLGIHLTLTSEWKSYRWGPLGSRKELTGLLDPGGFLWPDSPSVAKNAGPAEVEAEIRMQIDCALRAGMRPTHIDSHMGTVFAPAFFPIYVKLAREYRLPFFGLKVMAANPAMAALLKESDVLPDALVMANEQVKAEEWRQFYVNTIRALKPGLTEMIVHLGYDDAELQAIAAGHPAFGSAWRQRDFNVMTSPEFKKALEENKIILVGWKEIKKLTFANQ